MSERKVALITGAARRVGAALAREFAADHDLLLHYGNSRGEAEALAAEYSPTKDYPTKPGIILT